MIGSIRPTHEMVGTPGSPSTAGKLAGSTPLYTVLIRDGSAPSRSSHRLLYALPGVMAAASW